LGTRPFARLLRPPQLYRPDCDDIIPRPRIAAISAPRKRARPCRRPGAKYKVDKSIRF